MLLDEECKGCLYNSQLKKVRSSNPDPEKLKIFENGVKELCSNPPENYCSPLLMRDINRLHIKIFGSGIDYSREKKLFNSLLLNMEEQIFSRAVLSEEPLYEAVKFAVAANYIDFARLSDLGGEAVQTVLNAAERSKPDAQAIENLKKKLSSSEKLCYLHDNCGEIVLDKVLIKTIKRLYPSLKIYSIVRGKAVLNDVTEEDARDIGLYAEAEVLGNGSDAPGTYLEEISDQVKGLLYDGGTIISKGLGNLETLYGEGLKDVFYLFTCKCNHIAERFNLSLWSAAVVEE